MYKAWMYPSWYSEVPSMETLVMAWGGQDMTPGAFPHLVVDNPIRSVICTR